MSLWVALMLCLALVLAQIATPTRSVAMQDGNLIEICSEAGVAYVRMDAEGNVTETHDTPCPDCGDCTLCALSVLSTATGVGSPAQPGQTVACTASYATADVAPNPAQFWAANRGPPLQGTQKMYLSAAGILAPLPDERAMS